MVQSIMLNHALWGVKTVEEQLETLKPPLMKCEMADPVGASWKVGWDPCRGFRCPKCGSCGASSTDPTTHASVHVLNLGPKLPRSSISSCALLRGSLTVSVQH